MSNEGFNMSALPPDEAAVTPAAPVATKRAISRRSQAILRDNLVLVAMFAAGIVAVYALSLRGGPAQASAEQCQTEVQVDDALASMARKPMVRGETQTLIQTFYDEARQRQIPLEALRCNPFVYRAPAPVVTASGIVKPVEAAAPVDPEVVAALQAAKTLHLQSILSGAEGRLATISNNLLSQGQVISGWTVSKITPKDVTLTWRDRTHVLTLSD